MANLRALHKRNPVITCGDVYVAKRELPDSTVIYRIGTQLLMDHGSKAETWFLEFDREEAEDVLTQLTETLAGG